MKSLHNIFNKLLTGRDNTMLINHLRLCSLLWGCYNRLTIKRADSQGRVKVSTGGRAQQRQARDPRRLLANGGFGSKPKPTVIVRMEESPSQPRCGFPHRVCCAVRKAFCSPEHENVQAGMFYVTNALRAA